MERLEVVSGLVVGWAFKIGRLRELTPTERYVLVAVADNASDEGIAWPSRGFIVNKTGLSRATVYRALNSLRTKGLFTEGTDEKGRDLFRLPVQGSLSPGEKNASHSDAPESHSETPYIDEPSVEPSKEPTPSNSPSQREDVMSVWGCFLMTMRPRRKEPDEQQRRFIREALKVASVEECCRAIEACHASDFHMKRGEHERRRGSRYNRIGDILKGRPRRGESTRDRIDYWLDQAEQNDPPDVDANEEARRLREQQGLDPL